MKKPTVQIPSSHKVMHHITSYVWEHFAVKNHADANREGAKNAICMFVKASVDAVLPEQQHIFSSWANLGHPVLGQLIAAIHPFIVTNKNKMASMMYANMHIKKSVE